MILANYAWTMCVYTLPHESKIEAKPEHIYTFKTAPELDPLQYVNRVLLNAPWLMKDYLFASKPLQHPNHD
jgi:hypothetical protein